MVVGSILSELVFPSNNQTTDMKIKNMLALFLLHEFWARNKDVGSKLKDSEVI